MKRLSRWCLLIVITVLGCCMALAPAAAQERIHSYDVGIDIAADGSLDITETIRVRAEGSQVRRGIYRDFPTRYKDRNGNRVVVAFEVIGVERDGRREDWFTESLSNGVRVNTGGDAFLRVPADYTYTLRYRTNRQLGFFDAHDELYFNAIPPDWAFPIEQASVVVRLPEPVAEGALALEAYTGPVGTRGRHYSARVEAPGVARFESTRALRPGEAMTVVVGFPKGIVAAPRTQERVGWFLRDNLRTGIALFGTLGVLAFYLRSWLRHGRDPRPGVVFPQYAPPAGLSPALLRYVWKMGYSSPCFAADLVELGVRGLLRIEQRKALLSKSWWVHRVGSAVPEDLPESQRLLLANLMSTPSIELKQKNHVVIGAARDAHDLQLKKEATPRYYVANGGTVVLGGLMSLAVVFGAFLLAETDSGVLIATASLVVLFVVNILFAGLMRQPTAEGRALLDRIEGLRQYLGVAERDELRSLRAPGEPEPALDSQRYEALLPYALALEVEKAWTGRFVAAVGTAAAAQAAQRTQWYSGGQISSLGDVSSALGSSLSSAIASSATEPGSSSGGGGGGSSGGGGGGGGGGGR
jgi:uncharacterized membrane protein YgcG